MLSAYQLNTMYKAVDNLVENPLDPFLGDYADVVNQTEKTFGRD